MGAHNFTRFRFDETESVIIETDDFFDLDEFIENEIEGVLCPMIPFDHTDMVEKMPETYLIGLKRITSEILYEDFGVDVHILLYAEVGYYENMKIVFKIEVEFPNGHIAGSTFDQWSKKEDELLDVHWVAEVIEESTDYNIGVSKMIAIKIIPKIKNKVKMMRTLVDAAIKRYAAMI